MQSPHFQLSIHLLPEFGWTVNDNHVYGPGSALQGFVRVEHTMNDAAELLEIDQLRILFYASEVLAGPKSDPRCPTYTREQFFGTQHVLWRRKENGEQDMDNFQDRVQDFYFTIEMPMVQFPPSMEFPGLYITKFRLVASMYRKDCSAIVTSDEMPVEYMPLIESRQSKDDAAVTRQQQQQQGFTLGRSVEHNSIMTTIIARFESLNYVAGDQIQINLVTGNDNACDLGYHLILTRHLTTHDGRRLSTVIAESQSSPLVLPRDILPTVSYSKRVTVQYKLKVVVSPALGSSPRLSRLLRSKQLVTFDDVPIHIGTLGYGLRAPADLKPYSTFKSNFAQEPNNDTMPPLPVPRFTITNETRDILPVYEGYQLPNYEQECIPPF